MANLRPRLNQLSEPIQSLLERDIRRRPTVQEFVSVSFKDGLNRKSLDRNFFFAIKNLDKFYLRDLDIQISYLPNDI